MLRKLTGCQTWRIALPFTRISSFMGEKTEAQRGEGELLHVLKCRGAKAETSILDGQTPESLPHPDTVSVVSSPRPFLVTGNQLHSIPSCVSHL